MAIGRDDSRDVPTSLVTSREPSAPQSDNKTVGKEGLRDALIVIGIAWGILIFLVMSLRSHNI